MAGRATTPQGRKLGNINNMPNRRYLPSINFSVPFARWSHFYVSIDWTILITETFLSNSIPDSLVNLDGYTLYRTDRSDGRAGGSSSIVLLGTKYFGRHFSVTSKQINVNQALTSSQ
jgi:hypothetical protein